MKPRLEELIRYVHVDEETGLVERGCFMELVGEVLRCFGRPPMHKAPVEEYPLEDDEVDALPPDVPGYAIGLVAWEQGAFSLPVVRHPHTPTPSPKDSERG